MTKNYIVIEKEDLDKAIIYCSMHNDKLRQKGLEILHSYADKNQEKQHVEQLQFKINENNEMEL